MKKNQKIFPICLIFFPLFYMASLYSQNIGEVALKVIVRPSLILITIAGLLFGLFRLLTKNHNKSIFLSFATLFLLLTYGLFYTFLRDHPVFGLMLGKHSFLGALWGALFIIIIVLSISNRFKISKIVLHFLNLTTIFLFVYSAGSTVIQSFNIEPKSTINQDSSDSNKAQTDWLAKVAQTLAATKESDLPDIYYIIPDMFARNDAILNETGYDNTSFIEQLRTLGFYVAECSRSNYASTQLSIASSLNLNYLENIQDGMTDRPMLVTPMDDSLVRRSLEEIGYQTIFFENGFGLPEIREADVTVAYDDDFFLFEAINPFENLIVKNSMLRILYDVNLGAFSQAYDKLFFPYWQHVHTQKNIFDKLPETVSLDGPKFVFVHIMMPHPPYLIRENGEVETNSDYYREALGQPINEELYLEGYLMQVKYVQNRLIEAITQIIENSETEPVIIIQGDHGIRDENRLDILNVYFVPQSVDNLLYPTITPVNSFRLLFNGLFGTNYDVLADISRYSVYPDWFDMQVEPERNPSCLGTP